MDPLSLLSAEAQEALAALPADPERVARFLRLLAERVGPPHISVPVLEGLIEALPEAPDAEMALLNLERWSAFLPTPRSTLALLRESPFLLPDLLALFGASRYLSDILVRDPWLYSLFLEPDEPSQPEQYRGSVRAALRSVRRPESRRDALRRVKRREFLRIGWRDLARRAPLEEVVREISDLADALIEGALQLAREEVDPKFPTAGAAVRFAVVAMGKLGARELNYSSDVDLVFIMDSPTPQDEGHRRYATRLAETLVAILAQDTAEGRCFRVDMRLRPEGRFGALVRTYAAFRAYYDRWAETWERQALIKARPVAGDAELGARFLALTRPVVYRRLQGESLLQDVREMRSATERKLESAGSRDLHVKEGRGTIRDVEFTVQLLQLLFGADRPELQASDTLTALARLEETGLLAPEERAAFEDGYRFFREVEHRLQILNDLPVRMIPTSGPDIRRLGRSMGFRDGETFLAAYQAKSDAVEALAQAIHARLGGADGSDPLRAALLAADRPEGRAHLKGELERRGFPESEEALRALVRLAAGEPGYPHPSSTRRVFADLAPALLAECTGAFEPTWALEGLAEIADRKLLHRALYQSWLEDGDTLHGLSAVCGGAPAALKTILRYPELTDGVSAVSTPLSRSGPIPRPAAIGPTGDEVYPAPPAVEALLADLRERLDTADTYERRLSTLRRFRQREFVRAAAGLCLFPKGGASGAVRFWSAVADVLVTLSLETAVRRLRETGKWPREDAGEFAVFALGRYGGQELHFTSDLDLLYVYRPGEAFRQQQYELLAKALGEVLQAPTEDGRLFELDLRLRPEGRQGYTVLSLDGARRYYGEGGRAEIWELQMLTRLRFVTGSGEVGREFAELIGPRVYRDPMPEAWTGQIRAMKRRIETERVSVADRDRNLKLGPGGLSDIEFVVQYLQLRLGGAHPRLRVPSTGAAIQVMEEAGLVPAGEAGTLARAYAQLTAAREYLALMRPGGSADLLPDNEQEPEVARALARALDPTHPEMAFGGLKHEMAAAREVFLRYLG